MTGPAPERVAGFSLVDALVATADPQLWERYCRLATELAGKSAAVNPVFAVGSVEWQRRSGRPRMQQDSAVAPAAEAVGRQRLSRRGEALAFIGAPSPFGVAGGAAFDEFVASRRGATELLAELTAVEQRLIDAFEAAGRAALYCATGFCNGAGIEVEPGWFGRMEFDFAGNRLILPDGSIIAGVEARLAATAAAAPSAGHERRAKAMLREALEALWARGAFTAGTGNERVLALVLQELRLSAANPPYGFKSAETVRKLRKALNMSL
jgi:hypothetical protein